jgi:L-asparaginase II
MTWQALIEYKRANLTEVTKFGALCWVSGSKIVHLCGNDTVFFSRSTGKPFHLKVFAKDLDDVLTWEEKALSVASHTAEHSHLQIIDTMLSAEEKKFMQVPSFQHPCSGEHSALLRACERKHWSLKDYTSLRHPFHEMYLAYIRSVLGPQWHPMHTAKDGCGLATVSFKLSELATLYANLVREREQDWIWKAMIRNPLLVGGTGRLDTAILKSCNGRVLAKEGADGLLGMSIIHSDFPEGLGIFIKLAHGMDPQAMWALAFHTLNVLGWNIPAPNKLFRQRMFINPEIVPSEYRNKLDLTPSEDIDDTF